MAPDEIQECIQLLTTVQPTYAGRPAKARF